MVQQADLLPKSDEADVDGLRWMPAHTVDGGYRRITLRLGNVNLL